MSERMSVLHWMDGGKGLMTSSMRQRRRLSRAQKQKAVDLVLRLGLPCAVVARQLDIAASSLQRWMREHEQQHQAIGASTPTETSERDQLQTLAMENARLRKERDFFKLTAELLAKEHLHDKTTDSAAAIASLPWPNPGA